MPETQANEKIQALRRRLEEWQTAGPRPGEPRAPPLLAPRLAALQGLLPRGELPIGALTEIISSEGGGGLALALAIAASLAGGGPVVAIEAASAPIQSPSAGLRLYPPALVALGLDLSRLLLVRPADARQAAWALEESLGCPGLACVLALGPLLAHRPAVGRRLQMAARQGGGVGLLLRRPTEPPAFGAALRIELQERPEAGPASLCVRKGTHLERRGWHITTSTHLGGWSEEVRPGGLGRGRVGSGP